MPWDPALRTRRRNARCARRSPRRRRLLSAQNGCVGALDSGLAVMSTIGITRCTPSGRAVTPSVPMTAVDLVGRHDHAAFVERRDARFAADEHGSVRIVAEFEQVQ